MKIFINGMSYFQHSLDLLRLGQHFSSPLLLESSLIELGSDGQRLWAVQWRQAECFSRLSQIQ